MSILQIHMKGSRHCAAESRLKEKELYRQAQINKRIALSGNTASADTTDVPRQLYGITSKPLTQRTMKAVSEALGTNSSQQFAIPRIDSVKYTGNTVMNGSSSKYDNAIGQVVADKQLPQQQLDYKERKEKELKFTAAGWKRDGFGGWYKDESVSFLLQTIVLYHARYLSCSCNWLTSSQVMISNPNSSSKFKFCFMYYRLSLILMKRTPMFLLHKK